MTSQQACQYSFQYNIGWNLDGILLGGGLQAGCVPGICLMSTKPRLSLVEDIWSIPWTGHTGLSRCEEVMQISRAGKQMIPLCSPLICIVL